MFIINDKSQSCNDTFTDVQFRSLLAKNSYLKNTNYFYAVRISISFSYFVWNFHSNWLLF